MPVYANSGPGFGEGLLNFGNSYLAAKRQKRQDDLFEEQLAAAKYAQATQRAQNEASGLHIMQPGELLPPTVSRGLIDYAAERGNAATPNTVVNSAITFSPDKGGAPSLSRAAAGKANIPGQSGSFMDRLSAMVGAQPDRGAPYQVGNGYYIDKTPQWQKEDAARASMQGEKLFEMQLADMLARSKADLDVNTAARKAPIAVQQAIDTERGVGPLRAQNAVTQESAMAPIRTGQAIATARGIAPIDVGKAVDIFNAELPGRIAIGAASAANSANRPTDGQRQIAALVPEIRAAKDELTRMSTPTAFNTMLAKAGMFGNYLKTPEGQLYQQAANKFLNNLIYAKSGKTATDQERAALWHTYIDEPGDSPALKSAKMASREQALEGLGISGGALAQPRTAAPANVPRPPNMNDPGGNIDLGDTAGTTITVNGKTFKVPN